MLHASHAGADEKPLSKSPTGSASPGLGKSQSRKLRGRRNRFAGETPPDLPAWLRPPRSVHQPRKSPHPVGGRRAGGSSDSPEDLLFGSPDVLRRVAAVPFAAFSSEQCRMKRLAILSPGGPTNWRQTVRSRSSPRRQLPAEGGSVTNADIRFRSSVLAISRIGDEIR